MKGRHTERPFNIKTINKYVYSTSINSIDLTMLVVCLILILINKGFILNDNPILVQVHQSMRKH